ncbi:hypothetical protein BCT73_16555 [Vibrio breoganii]|nr:hypothetical protein BCT73_16555 [Vibrio breoganii]PMO79457.1 hypothetical protein BCT00_16320 [Vibrio breoganii]
MLFWASTLVGNLLLHIKLGRSSIKDLEDDESKNSSLKFLSFPSASLGQHTGRKLTATHSVKQVLDKSPRGR